MHEREKKIIQSENQHNSFTLATEKNNHKGLKIIFKISSIFIYLTAAIFPQGQLLSCLQFIEYL